MGKKHHRRGSGATVSSSPSSSSDFEFAISNSPATKNKLSSQLIPADELFYKGQLLPLHLSPRISMVRTLLLASSSGSSSSDTTATGSRDSNGSSNDSTSSFSGDLLLLAASASECESPSRPSSVAEEDSRKVQRHHLLHSKYLSSLATKFSAVFHRNRSNKSEAQISDSGGVSSCYFAPQRRRTASGSGGVTESIKRYVSKVKPFCDKLSSRHNNGVVYEQKPHQKKTFSFSIGRGRVRSHSPSSCSSAPLPPASPKDQNIRHSHSFSGNLRYPRRKKKSSTLTTAVSCPSSMRSSPTHSGLLSRSTTATPHPLPRPRPPEVSKLKPPSHHRHHSMEDLQSAIQGAIAHCKSSMAKATN